MPAARVALVIRHVAFEDLGILAPVLKTRGYEIRYVEAGVDELSTREADLLVVLGGPIGVGDLDRYPFLSDELQAVGAGLERGVPTLGICLGAQLIAKALGAEVKPTGRVEIGFAPLTLTPEGERSPLGGLGQTPVLHWHGDEFQIPAGAVRLAETPGFPNQAFSYGPRVLGLQPHLEADHTRLEQWLIGHAHELAAHHIDLAQLREDGRRHGPALDRIGGAVLGGWLDQLEPATS